ncbi:MAG TPA: NAD(P)H-hydrate dehydratase [Candidatus Kapabacteria bacterium]|jgi:NAD(P)H-hydrate epimerase|nr:NAD(P)H-hydrate dehydratase [Candidatus Kapabacteria bacterium]HOM05554.1 NAD(P)H-hydrate dehydratase [Candidatus Kapabacteria bacterium]HPP39298.1 NAD(P)H-hydrate dehydratase [Candidatus Kapabacteria bacterium]
MKPVASAEKSKLIDKAVMEDLRLSSGPLMMENAARSCFEIIKNHYGLGFRNCLVLCGVGNNGGDGFALARLLSEYFPITIYVIGDLSKMSEETKANFEFAKNNRNKIVIQHFSDENQISSANFDFELIIDALVGVGGGEELRGLVVPLLKKANQANSVKIAIDVPTGLNSTTGKFHPDVFRASSTITMFCKKRAMLDKSLSPIFGEIFVAYLGFDSSLVLYQINEWEIEPQDYSLLHTISVDANKYDCGKIALVAGSRHYPGAAAIASNAAVASGAGLVHLFSTAFHPQLKPEVIHNNLLPDDDGFIAYSENYISQLIHELSQFDVVAIGPGLGASENTLKTVEKLLLNLKTKIILDADALRIVPKLNKLGKNVIITPHLGEFSRILGVSKADILQNKHTFIKEFCEKYETNLLLKGSTTIVSDGSNFYYSTSGNCGLASGGTGDALTGIISAFAVRSDSLAIAGAIAAFIHGLSADLYAREYSTESVTASEVINYLGKAIRCARNEI